MQNKKGQGSLEYLLIIGGGILVAVVIIGAIVSLAGTGTGGTRQNVANQTCSTFLELTACQAYLITGATGGTPPTGYACPVEPADCCWLGTAAVGMKCQAKFNLTFS